MSGGDGGPGAERPLPSVAVFGCGLVGASLAAALSEAGYTLSGCDRRDLSPLVERGWLAQQIAVEELSAADLVVLALPPAGVTAALSRLPFRRGQVVTDVASVKASVAAAGERLPPGVVLVPGHPLAGGTGSGFEAARPDLFAGAAWVLCPAVGGSPEVRDAARERVRELVTAAGAEPVHCDAERHDRIVALTSHLPQLLSTVLAAELEALDDPLAGRLLGPGGRDFLRLARSPWELWRDILAGNREPVARALGAVAVRAGAPPEALGPEFEAARRWMERLDEE